MYRTSGLCRGSPVQNVVVICSLTLQLRRALFVVHLVDIVFERQFVEIVDMAPPQIWRIFVLLLFLVERKARGRIGTGAAVVEGGNTSGERLGHRPRVELQNRVRIGERNKPGIEVPTSSWAISTSSKMLALLWFDSSL